MVVSVHHIEPHALTHLPKNTPFCLPLQTYVEKTKGVTFPKLVEEAFLLFHKLFRDKLLQVRRSSDSCRSGWRWFTFVRVHAACSPPSS